MPLIVRKTKADDDLKSSVEQARAQAMTRIGRQVHHLIMPDFRALSKVLRDLVTATILRRQTLAADAAQVQAEAMAAATQLMLLGTQDRPAQEPNYFKRIAYDGANKNGGTV